MREQGMRYDSYMETWKDMQRRWTFETHIVNIGMMFKCDALYEALFGEKLSDTPEKMWRHLEKYHGTAVGTFSGDECLAGLAPNRGTELCHVVELMYSCEWLYRLTGRREWMDRLEKAAFNALPATLSDDMWTHQYDQCVNQIACMRFAKSPFGTNNVDANLFGLEPNYGCCTANFNQGWPKLAMHVFLSRSEREIECAMLLPAALHTKVKGVPVTVTIRTEYPFRHTAAVTVKAARPVSMKLRIRIPGWSRGVTVDGETRRNTGYVTVSRTWSDSETVRIELHDEVRFERRPFGLQTVGYGPLVFSLPIPYTEKQIEYEGGGVERRFPYCDYELLPEGEWRWGFADGAVKVCTKRGDDVPFSSKHPRLALRMRLCPVDWRMEEEYGIYAAAKPKSPRAKGKPVVQELIPYGCAKLRMTAMPRVR
jgi:hypothetical protein